MLLKKHSFREMGDKIWEYVNGLYQPGDRFPYPLQEGNKGTLLGTIFASLIAYMLGKEQDLKGMSHIIDEILDIEDTKTGLFKDPDINSNSFLQPEIHSPIYVSLQTTYFCRACLQSLGLKLDHGVSWVLDLLPEGNLEKWLNSLNWKDPWLVSNIDMFTGIFLLEFQQMGLENDNIKDGVKRYFQWHDKNQSGKTGFWGNEDDYLNLMAGGYHIILHYDFYNQKLNHIKQIIDTTLSLPWKDGLFVYGGGGGSCEDMDAIDILVRLSQYDSYRNENIKQTLQNASKMLIIGQNNDGGFGWRIQPTTGRLLNLITNNEFKTQSLIGLLYSGAFKIMHRSHFNSTFYYSSLATYPFCLNKSDMWSTWFRALSLALIARRYPDLYFEKCNWKFPFWPGLGCDPFTII